MRITGLHIDRFGIWSDLTMKDMPDGMTVFFGPNEAGKSTLMQFVRTMLYGFHPDRCARFVADRKKHSTFIQPDGRLGGSLFVTSKDGDFQIRRYADESDPLGSPGEVRLTTKDGSRHGAQRLGTLLAGIDDTIYTNVFAVGLQEMQAISALHDTQAARQLYSLTTGADRVSLVDIMRQLRDTQSRLVGGEDRSSLLAELIQQREQLEAEITQHQSQQERWARMVTERDSLSDEMARLEKVADESLRRADLAELALRIQPNWEELRRLDRELQTLGNPTAVPPRIFKGLEAIATETESLQTQSQNLQERRSKLRERLAAVADHDAVQRNSARLVVALEQRATIVGLEERVARAASELEELEFEIQAEQERLGLVGERDATGGLPRLDPLAIESLQQPARELDRIREQLEVAKKEAGGYKEDARRISRELAVALGRSPDWFEKNESEDVRAALQESSSVATGLKRRVNIDREIARIQQRQVEVDNDRADIVAGQLMPWELVRAIGVLFSAGAMMFLSGLFGHTFGWSDQWRGMLLVAGGIATGLAVLLKISLDHPAQGGMREVTRRAEELAQQLQTLQAELEQLDQSLPLRQKSAEHLNDTRTEIVRLEALLPLEEQRHHTLRLAEEAERRAVEIARSLKAARDRWEKALADQGLSTKLTPTQLSALAGQTGSLRRLHARFDELQLEAQRVQQEQAATCERLRDLLHDVQVRDQSTTAVEYLDQLAATLQAHQDAQKLKESLREEDRQLKRELQSLSRQQRQLDRRRDRWITSAGAVDMSDLERMRQQAIRHRKIVQARDELRVTLHESLGAEERARSITQELERASDGDLSSRLERSRAEFDKVAARLKQVQYRQGELDEQIRQLAADRTLSDLHLRLGVLQHQLDECVGRWQVVHTIGGMLKTVYKKYEKERQPETLKEASQFLERMTSGKYCRIWTPLSEDILLLDDRDGRSAPIDLLSRGTREQLFLSLRLAMIASYATRGVKMPLILDDVLVNFDAERSAAAAQVLIDFARSGHQTLVFTCHEHIRDLFSQLQADVRELPRHEGRHSPRDAAPAQEGQKRAKRKGKPVVVLGFADAVAAGEQPNPVYVNDWWRTESLPPSFAADAVLLGYREPSNAVAASQAAIESTGPSADSPWPQPAASAKTSEWSPESEADLLAWSETNADDEEPPADHSFAWLDYVEPPLAEPQSSATASPVASVEASPSASEIPATAVQPSTGPLDNGQDMLHLAANPPDSGAQEPLNVVSDDEVEDEPEDTDEDAGRPESSAVAEAAEIDPGVDTEAGPDEDVEEYEFEYVDVEDGEIDDDEEYEYVYVDEDGQEIDADEVEDEEPEEDTEIGEREDEAEAVSDTADEAGAAEDEDGDEDEEEIDEEEERG